VAVEKKMTKTGFVFLSLILILAACVTPPTVSPTPPSTATVALAAFPTLTLPPTPTATATPSVDGNLFSKVSRSTSVLHLRCDPLEIIFDVTVKDPKVKGVVFFFRMKDKATGLVSSWLTGGDMRPVGNDMFEFNFRASTIPADVRYKDAWVQYQFVGINQDLQSIGHSQIFSEELTFTPKCP
jgi:hypothetical protein